MAADDFLTIQQIAELAGVKPGTINQHRRRGTIPPSTQKFGVVPVWERSVIDEWIATRRTNDGARGNSGGSSNGGAKHPRWKGHWRDRVQVDADGCWLLLSDSGARAYLNGTAGSRAVWIELNGPIPDGLNVCHHCDKPPCVKPECLFLGTQQENMTDMVKKGRQWTGGPFPREENK